MKPVLWLITILFATVSVVACTAAGQREEPTRGQRAAAINVQLGVGYLKNGNLKLAKVKLDRALEQDPRLSTAHWSYALLEMRLGNEKKAEQHFRKAIALDPEDSMARNNYGLFLCNRGRIDEALEQFHMAVKNRMYIEPESAYTNAGICVLKQAETDLAETEFRSALKANSRYPQALYQMAKLTFSQRHYLQSRAFLQRYEDIAVDTAGSLWLGFQIEHQMGNYAQAEEYAQRLKQQYPESRETTSLLELEHEYR